MPSPSRRPRAIARRALARAATPVVLTVVAAVAVAPARAQAPGAPGAVRVGAPQPELRADAIVSADRQAFHLGAGVLWPMGRAVRAGLVAGAGPADGEGMRSPTLGWRAELVAHFVVRTSPAGRARLYAGAGAGALASGEGPGRAVAHLLVGTEGAGRGWEHAVEVGLGGGVRLGVVLRRAR